MNIMKPRQQANKLVTILYYSNNVYKKGLLPFTNHFENGVRTIESNYCAFQRLINKFFSVALRGHR